jgi:hypothetical protein
MLHKIELSYDVAVCGTLRLSLFDSDFRRDSRLQPGCQYLVSLQSLYP